MKITFLGPAYPYRGGLAAFNERLAQQFTSECKDVDIRTFRIQYPGFLFPGKTQYSEGPAPEGLRIIREINSVNPFNWIKTGRKIKRERADILLIRYWIPFLAPCLGVIARIVKSNKYTIVIALVDNALPHEKRAGDRFLTKFFMNSINGAVAMSEFVQKDVESFRRDIPICMTPHPLFDNYGRKIPRNDALSSLKLDPEYSYILFFGLIRAYKGLDLLLEAFSDQVFRNKKLKIIVAGEFYESETPYKNIVRQNGLEDSVIFYSHYIPDNEVAIFFSAADLVVQPYRSATQSGVTQIALQFDRPIVVTDVGGLKETVINKKSGYVVKPHPEAIASAITDYFDNDRRSILAAGVKMEKGKYSWNKMTDAITEVFYKCLLNQLISSL
jgi:glycosyltransferase involved in cell wall biosynthesis